MITATGPTPDRESVDASAGRRIDDATRLAVLEAVERGEIDVEEALRRLDPHDTGAEP